MLQLCTRRLPAGTFRGTHSQTSGSGQAYQNIPERGNNTRTGDRIRESVWRGINVSGRTL